MKEKKDEENYPWRRRRESARRPGQGRQWRRCEFASDLPVTRSFWPFCFAFSTCSLATATVCFPLL